MANWMDFVDPNAPTGRYLRWKEVERSTGLSRTTAWRLQRAGDFPRPYVISPGRVGYLECEVEAWRASRGHRTDTRRDRGPRAATAVDAAATEPGARAAACLRQGGLTHAPRVPRGRRKAAISGQIQFDF